MILPISEPAGVLAIVFAIVLTTPLLARKASVPNIVCLALAGIIVGPHGLGLIAANGTIEFIGGIGALYALFAAGAELDAGQIRRAILGGRPGERRGALVFFPLAFGLPFAAGTIAGTRLLGMERLPALLLGCLLASSATLSDHAAARTGLWRQRSVAAASGGAALSTAAAMVAFAVLTRLATIGSGENAWAAVGWAALWALASFAILPRAAALFLRKVKPDGTVEFAFVLTLTFACAYSAKFAGLEPAIGAFFAGFLLGRFMPESSILLGRIKFLGEALLLPFFMVYAGALADPLQAFTESSSLGAAGIIVALGLAASYLAAGGAALILGYSRHERRMLFGLSASRATPTLALALAGFKLGLLDQGVLDGTMFLVLFSCAAASFVSRVGAKRLAACGDDGVECRSAVPERILVAVANPSSIRNLVELSFLLRGSGNKEPIYPVAVVPESSDTAAELAAAENRLAQAVVQGVAAGVPVIPSTRVSINAHEGVLEAARENRANVIIIGWNKAPKLSHAFFGSVIEQVILGGSELVIVARTAKSLGQIGHVALVLPTLIERHPGFQRARAVLASLVARSGAKLVAYTLEGQGSEAKSALAGVATRGGLQIVELASWKELGSDLKTANAASRAFIFFSARPGESAWHPAVEKLPHRLGEEYPDSPLLLFYLPEGSTASALASGAEASDAAATNHVEGEEAEGGATAQLQRDLLDKALAAGRVRPAMKETAIADGIRELLRSAFDSDRKALGKLSNLFTQMAQSQPIELEPGVLLLHAHIEEAKETMIFFGARPEGFHVLALEESVRILIILCAPIDQAPEEHLATLGQIALLFKDGRVASRLGIPSTT